MKAWIVPLVALNATTDLRGTASASITIDDQTRTLTLTRGEAAVLNALVGANGATISKADIAAGVSSAPSNVVEVLIGRLRKKLEAAGCPDLIITIRAGGYRFGFSR